MIMGIAASLLSRTELEKDILDDGNSATHQLVRQIEQCLKPVASFEYLRLQVQRSNGLVDDESGTLVLAYGKVWKVGSSDDDLGC